VKPVEVRGVGHREYAELSPISAGVPRTTSTGTLSDVFSSPPLCFAAGNALGLFPGARMRRARASRRGSESLHWRHLCQKKLLISCVAAEITRSFAAPSAHSCSTRESATRYREIVVGRREV